MDVLPQVMVDFLPPLEVLQTVVNEFISPHQSRPELAAVVMTKVGAKYDGQNLRHYVTITILQAFNLLMTQDKQSVVCEWVCLCLENFLHQ